MALITCPECKKLVSYYNGSCPNCGFPLPTATVTELLEKEKKRNIIYAGKLLAIVFTILIILYVLGKPSENETDVSTVPKVNIEKENSSNYSSPVYKGNAENEINSYSSSSNRYVVKEEIIFAATSKTSFDLMGNCLVDGDKQALQTMLLNGQLKYLYRNDVVFLVEPKFSYYIVRQEGSTELLYVVSELLRKQ